jgi:hypothetical protein
VFLVGPGWILGSGNMCDGEFGRIDRILGVLLRGRFLWTRVEGVTGLIFRNDITRKSAPQIMILIDLYCRQSEHY